MKNNLFFLALTTLNIVAISQNIETRYSNFQTDIFYGFPIEHDTSLDNAIQGNTSGFLLNWNAVKSKNSKFNALFNYPERGYSFLYQNFNSSILGKTFSAYRHYTYNLTPKRKNHLKLTTGFGLGFATEKYDEVDNPENFAIGSHFLASALFKLQYLQFFEENRIRLNTGISIIHFSNMSFKNPNLGINSIAINLGLNYKLTKVKIIEKDTLFTIDNKIKFRFIVRGGYNQSKEINSDLHPFIVGGFSANKTINPYSTINIGTEYFNSQFLKDYAEYINSESDDTNRVGIFIGHELTQNHFAFITQVGIYVYQPVFYESSIYERFGFNYKLSDHLFAEVTLKVNLFRAEALEFGIGYTF